VRTTGLARRVARSGGTEAGGTEAGGTEAGGTEAGATEGRAALAALDALDAIATSKRGLRLTVLAAEVTGDAHGLDREGQAG